MNGLLIQAPIAVTNTNIPKLYPHPLMSNGTLLLTDAVQQGSSGVPTNGSTITNVASSTAMALIAGSTLSDVTPTFTYGASVGGTASLLERTAKGGLHAIISKTNDISAATSYARSIPLKIKQYIDANPTHQFYVGCWAYITRGSASGNTALSFFASNNSNLYYSLQGTPLPTSGNVTNYVGGLQSPVTGASFYTTTGLRFADIGFVGKIGTPTSASGGVSLYIGNGSIYPIFHGSFSAIDYMYVIEDLTVSGRTYAQVSALSQSLQNDAFSIGGKYYGDTFTNPSTLP